MVKIDDGCACGRFLRRQQRLTGEGAKRADADFAMYWDDEEEAGFRSVQSIGV
jgi:hypothetical protein